MMSKRMLINYLLLVLIIIFTWIGVKYPIRPDQVIDRNAITRIKSASVDKIQVDTADNTFSLIRDNNVWYLNAPINWYANNVLANRLASLAEVTTDSKLDVQEIDLTTLGLQLPQAVVTLNTTSVSFGTTNQIGNRRYLRVESTVYLVDDVHFPLLQLGLGSFVDKRLLPPDLLLKQIKFADFGLTQSLETGIWHSSRQTDDSSAEDLVSHWQTLQAREVNKFKNQQTPLSKISVTLANDKTIDFYLMTIEPQLVLARPDLRLQYHFSADAYYSLIDMKQDVE